MHSQSFNPLDLFCVVRDAGGLHQVCKFVFGLSIGLDFGRDPQGSQSLRTFKVTEQPEQHEILFVIPMQTRVIGPLLTPQI